MSITTASVFSDMYSARGEGGGGSGEGGVLSTAAQ